MHACIHIFANTNFIFFIFNLLSVIRNMDLCWIRAVVCTTRIYENYDTRAQTHNTHIQFPFSLFIYFIVIVIILMMIAMIMIMIIHLICVLVVGIYMAYSRNSLIQSFSANSYFNVQYRDILNLAKII